MSRESELFVGLSRSKESRLPVAISGPYSASKLPLASLNSRWGDGDGDGDGDSRRGEGSEALMRAKNSDYLN